MITYNTLVTQEWRIKLNDIEEYSQTFYSLRDALEFGNSLPSHSGVETRSTVVFTATEKWIRKA
jgi:hypothetical protein